MRTLTARLFLLVFAIASMARAHTRVLYELKGDQLVVTGAHGFTTSVAVGCRGLSYFEHAEKLYVACGREGIVIFSTVDPENPVLEVRAPTEDAALAFFLVDDDVWVRMQNQVARPVSTALESRPQPIPRAKVRPATFKPAQRRLGGIHESCRDNDDCEGHLRCVEEVCISEEASKPSGPDIYLVERRTGLSLGFETFGYIPAATAGVGVLFGAHASYRFSFPVAVRLALSPLGLTWADLGNILATSYAGVITLDTQYFEMGAGPGVMTLNSRDGPQPAFLMSLYFRLGAADGVSMWFRPDVALVSRSTTSSWEFGSFSGGIHIPVTERWTLVLRGGGGNSGWARGDLGMRFRLVGDGKHRSVFVTVAAGGAGMFLSANGVTYGGPSIGGAIEWRP